MTRRPKVTPLYTDWPADAPRAILQLRQEEALTLGTDTSWSFELGENGGPVTHKIIHDGDSVHLLELQSGTQWALPLNSEYHHLEQWGSFPSGSRRIQIKQKNTQIAIRILDPGPMIWVTPSPETPNNTVEEASKGFNENILSVAAGETLDVDTSERINNFTLYANDQQNPSLYIHMCEGRFNLLSRNLQPLQSVSGKKQLTVQDLNQQSGVFSPSELHGSSLVVHLTENGFKLKLIEGNSPQHVSKLRLKTI